MSGGGRDVELVYGPGCEDGALVFRWLAPSVVPISVSMLFGYALLAAGGERRYVLASPVAVQIAVGAVVSVAGVAAFKGLTAADVGLTRERARTAPSAPTAAFE